ncbi:glutathione S-transferase family protein [Sphingomonas sp. KR1UV-12]|uniref:Glutathione S-transferase family protein n=1 Tax=Sphingomonas aurea TaxID=3063994 RepID=A0ABT9EFH0_9SPHN|nr:glutathione S-transferase family protein [Sphingomonas sp. KR1UV-12]MDP1025716.1 glutathione S-transferase family protein [Sphingomonas sp. KR1UV-12]
MALTFYTNPQSRGRIVRWMLEEIGEPYDTVVLDYATTMKGDAYRAINPMMKVPAIVHDGRVVTEVAAICAYLAETFPSAGLAPTADERAGYYRWLFFAAGPLEAAVTNKSMGFTPNTDQQRMAGYGNFELTAGVLADAVERHPYIAGDRFTAADVCVGSGVGWYTQFGLLEKTPAFTAYLERLHARPAFQRAAALDDAAIAAGN